MEWTFSGEQGTGYFVNDWETHLANAPSYYRYERGYEERFGNDFYRSGEEIKTSTDVDLVTYSFMACHERCGSKISYGDDVSRLYRRLDEAHKFLAQLNSGGTGGGADYENAEPWQKAIHDNALTTPSPGAGWCAMWVSQVYYNAGFGYIGGNADDMYYRYCHSSDRSELKVGMLIAVDKYVTNGYPYAGYSPDGRKLSYHVGIYMGNGMVRDNIGSITDVYDIIDSRYKNRRPMVVTTNLDPNIATKSDADDAPWPRIFTRILERCAPIKFAGENRREYKMMEMREAMRKRLGL